MAQTNNLGGSAAAKVPERRGVPWPFAPIGRLTIRVINDMGAATIFFTKACVELFARDKRVESGSNSPTSAPDHGYRIADGLSPARPGAAK